ncbi:MAG TPA: hypothetical protein VFA71_00030 [Terriglobales bacterium]|nr:hypothetical protein [Terriglobales bacterium]
MQQSRAITAVRFWQQDGIYIILMLVIFGLRFWPAFAHGCVYAPFQDNLWVYGPVFSRASEIALTGSFPYWLDTLLGGFPLYQTPHFSATYPFYFFGLVNYGKAIEVLYTLSHVACFQSLILYLNLYILLRVAGARGLAALCGATVGLVSSNTEVCANWVTVAAAWSWFPLLIAGLILLLRSPLSYGSVAVFALAAGLMCTASPSQPLIESAFVCAVFVAAAGVWRWRRDAAAAARFVIGVGMSVITAVGLAAVAFVPMWLATGGMIRHIGEHAQVMGHASIPWTNFYLDQLSPSALIHLFFDPSKIAPLGGLYVGPFALMGVLLCVIAYSQHGSLMRFVLVTSAAIAIYFLLSAFGTYFGVAYLNFHVPLLNRIREASRFLTVFTLFTALFAGLGFQVIMDVASEKLKLKGGWRLVFWVAMSLGVLIFALALVFDRHWRATGWLVLGALPLGWFLLPSPLRLEGFAGNGLLLLACLASVLSPPGTQPLSVSQYLLDDNLASHRVLRRLAQLPDIGDYRVVILGTQIGPTNWAANASYYGIRSFYMNFTPQPYDQFREMFDEQPIGLRKLRGAKYFICGGSVMPGDPRAKLLFTESGYRVYEVPDAMGPYALLHKALAVKDETVFVREMSGGFDYHHVAAVEKSKRPAISRFLAALRRKDSPATVTSDLVEPIIRAPNYRAIFINSTEPGLLILNERWNEAWHARVNSQPVEVLRANFVQPAVALPAGRNYVEFEYRPTLFWYLLILQRITFALLLLVGILHLARSRLFGQSGSSQTQGHCDNTAIAGDL